jgi:hypothetical protein
VKPKIKKNSEKINAISWHLRKEQILCLYRECLRLKEFHRILSQNSFPNSAFEKKERNVFKLDDEMGLPKVPWHGLESAA